MKNPSEEPSHKLPFFQRVRSAWRTLRGQQDIRLAVGKPGEEFREAILKRAKQLGRTYSHEYFSSFPDRQGDFVGPAYDLAEIGRVLDVEPFVYQSVRKHREMILKEGYELDGDEPEVVDYCKKRLYEIQIATGIPTEQIVRELATNLVTYHNAQLVLRRDIRRSTGHGIKLYNRKLDPICGIFVADPTTMQAKVDRYGTIRKWRQQVNGKESFFDPRDVIDFSIDRKPGFTFGTPYVLPVLADIRALRHLEEMAGVLATREAFPLYHIKVGTENQPAMILADGSDEVGVAEGKFGNMPTGGVITTSERYEVVLVSSESGGIDLLPFLEYFAERVKAGLRMSDIDLGKGNTSNRSTAQTMAKSVEDAAQDYQKVLSTQLTHKLLFWLVLEGKFNVNHKNFVKFKFPMIDREELRAHQNHGLQLFMSNALTEEEYRKDYLGRPPIKDRTGTYREMEAKVQSDLQKQTQATRNQVGNTAQPANQSGKKATKTRVTANSYETAVDAQIDSLKADLMRLSDPEEVRERFSRFVNTCCQNARLVDEELIRQGMSQAEQATDADEDVELGRRALDRFRSNFIRKSLLKVTSPYADRMAEFYLPDEDNNRSQYLMFGCIESFRKSMRRLVQDQLITCRRFGFAYAAKKLGHKEIVLGSGTDSQTVDITKIIYKELIPIPATADWEIGLE